MPIIIQDDDIALNLTVIIDKLLKVNERPGKPAQLKKEEIINLNLLVRKIFLKQPTLIEVKAPVNVCGDIHGQYYDLLRLFNMCGYPETNSYLFLGDYVDRGRQSIESICLLFAYKIKFPTTMNLLRGNHESGSITKVYGFFDECKRRYNIKVWQTFIDTFNVLPICAIIDDLVFCTHGGLSPELLKGNISNMSELKKVLQSFERPCTVPDKGLLCDLLWSDPWFPPIPTEQNFKKLNGWKLNERGVSFQFGPDIIDAFINKFGFVLVVRGHQVVEDGYEFYANRSLLTIFSAPNYCGEFDNAAAVLCIDVVNKHQTIEPSNLKASFKILKPQIDLDKWINKKK